MQGAEFIAYKLMGPGSAVASRARALVPLFVAFALAALCISGCSCTGTGPGG
jgi:hypothetical protein